MAARNARFAHLFLAAVGGGVVALVLQAGFGALIPKAEAAGDAVVRAQRFEVLDAAGRVSARLAYSSGAPHLTLYDGSGVARTTLLIAADAGGFMLSDAAGRPQISIVADASPSLQLIDSRGKMRALLGLASGGGTPSVQLFDAGETVRAGVAVDAAGKPSVQLFDAAGKMRAWSP